MLMAGLPTPVIAAASGTIRHLPLCFLHPAAGRAIHQRHIWLGR